MVNLTSGEVLAPDPKHYHGDNPEGLAWLKEQGIDLIAYAMTDSGDQGLTGYAMMAVKVDNGQFDALDMAGVREILEKAAKGMHRSPATMMSIKAGLPVTYAFRAAQRRVRRSADRGRPAERDAGQVPPAV